MLHRILWICALLTSTVNYPVGYCSCAVYCAEEDLAGVSSAINGTTSSLVEPCCNCLVSCEERTTLTSNASTTPTTMLSSDIILSPEKSRFCYNGQQQDFASLTGFEEMNSSEVIQHQICPNGWRRHGESCFNIEMEKLPFDVVEKRCKDNDSEIFAADSLDEWDEVMSFTPRGSWTWIGTGQENGTVQWRGALDASRLNWLVMPFSPQSNGWTTISNCAAYSGKDTAISSHVFFYPCSSQFHSICKKKIAYHV